MHFYKFHINDYAVQTRHLTNIEDLCFRRLLDLYYTNEKPLKLDHKWLAKKVQVNEKVVEVILEDFFTKTSEGWINRRADGEIAEYHGYISRQAIKGKKGGRPPKPTDNPQETHGLTVDNPRITHGKASVKPSVISNQESDTPIVPSGDISIDLIDQDLALHRAKMLFRMRPSTALDHSQNTAWKKNKRAVESTSEGDWLLLEWYFAQGGEVAEYRRRDLATLLNNWNGEIQRATEIAKKKGSNFGKKEKATEEQVVPANWREILIDLHSEAYPEGMQSGNFPSNFRFLPASVQAEIREQAALTAEIKADIHRNAAAEQAAA